MIDLDTTHKRMTTEETNAYEEDQIIQKIKDVRNDED